MRVSEIIQGTLDLINGLDLGAKTGDQKSAEYANAPHEVTHTVAKVVTGGDDIHHEKHPSDMRSDSVSLYPNQGK